MERDDWDGDEFVEVAIPTELVKRVVNAISAVMREWELERREDGEEFNALIGRSAAHLAVRFIDDCMEKIPGETMQ